ncbi:MAG: sensor histidine kinase [Trueperaceae bacterium]
MTTGGDEVRRLPTRPSVPVARDEVGRRTYELATLHRLGGAVAAPLDANGVLSGALSTLVEMGWFACGEAFRVEDGEPEAVSVGACPFEQVGACPLRPALLTHARQAIRDGVPTRRDRWWLVPVGERGLLALAAAEHGHDVSHDFLRSVVELVAAALDRTALHERLVRKEADRSRLLQALLRAQEEERTRMSRDLHDQIGQALTGIVLGLDRAGDPSVRSDLKALASATLADVRRIAKDLRPAVLDELGLDAAVRRYARDVRDRFGLEVEVAVQVPAVPTGLATTLYRVVQEALTNVVRHAGARSASVVVTRSGGAVELVIEDDGRGFDVASASRSNSIGLVGMRERIELAGGSLHLESLAGRGTSVHARVPVAAWSDGSTAAMANGTADRDDRPHANAAAAAPGGA